MSACLVTVSCAISCDRASSSRAGEDHAHLALRRRGSGSAQLGVDDPVGVDVDHLVPIAARSFPAQAHRPRCRRSRARCRTQAPARRPALLPEVLRASRRIYYTLARRAVTWTAFIVVEIVVTGQRVGQCLEAPARGIDRDDVRALGGEPHRVRASLSAAGAGDDDLPISVPIGSFSLPMRGVMPCDGWGPRMRCCR